MEISKINARIILALFAPVISFFLIPQTVFCQTEKLGIVSYAPPKGWTKTSQENAVVFSEINQATGRFCFVTLYAATASTGNPTADFKREWNNLVVEPWKGEANPKTETETAEGWTAIAGGGPVDFDGNTAVGLLTVHSGFGKTVSVLGILNDESYLPQLTDFVASLKLDKTAPATTPNPINNQKNQPGKFGSLTYAPPAGWSEQQFADGVVFKPLDLPAGENLSIQIMPPLNAAGTLDQALAQSFDEAAAMYNSTKMNYAGSGKSYDQTEAKKSFQGWEYIRGKGGVQVENGTPYKTELGLELFVVKVNNRFERVAILESRKNCNLSRYYASDRRNYRNNIENLLFSLRSTDLSEPALSSGSTKGAGIVGVWQGISLQTSAVSGIRYNVYSPIFLSNGQAYFGPKFPSEGLDELNTRIPPELFRRDWGTYSFSNGRGVLKMPYGDIPLRLEAGKLIITANQTDHRFYQLQSVDGATFTGTYTLSGSEGKTVSIMFGADGRFVDNGAISVLYHEYVDCINPAINPGSGTYQVKDYSVMFNYSDGRKVKIAFLGADYDKANPGPATLLMSSNEDKLIRQ